MAFYTVVVRYPSGEVRQANHPGIDDVSQLESLYSGFDGIAEVEIVPAGQLVTVVPAPSP